MKIESISRDTLDKTLKKIEGAWNSYLRNGDGMIYRLEIKHITIILNLSYLISVGAVDE